MSSSQPPRPRPTPSPAPVAVPSDAPVADDSDVLAAPKPRRRLNPLRRRRRGAEPAPGVEHDEDWDDEYEDEYDDDVEDLEDEYDDGYEDDELYEDEYDDGYEDDYDDDLEDDDGPYEDDAPAGTPRRRRRRLLPRGRRRAAPEGVDSDAPAGHPTAPIGAAEPVVDDEHDYDDHDEDGQTGTATPSRRGLGGRLGKRRGGRSTGPRPGRRPRRRRPVAAVRQGAGRRITGARTGITGAGRRVGTGVGRGWTGTRSGVSRAAHFVRTHWGRAAYIYLGIVGLALLVTLLLYWNSGFTYDECNSCGIPLLLSVSPWWLLIVPFNLTTWPLFLPIVVLILFAGLNAELINRYSKRPQPLYPDWD
jgi:hypothetical protein